LLRLRRAETGRCGERTEAECCTEENVFPRFHDPHSELGAPCLMVRKDPVEQSRVGKLLSVLAPPLNYLNRTDLHPFQQARLNAIVLAFVAIY